MLVKTLKPVRAIPDKVFVVYKECDTDGEFNPGDVIGTFLARVNILQEVMFKTVKDGKTAYIKKDLVEIC